MKELDYYCIGESYGSNQDWFTDSWMNRGGCGAITACDTCIYLAKYKNMKELYPFDAENVTKEDFVKFGMMMKPYLSPREHGINKTETFIGGFNDYLLTREGARLKMTSVEGTEDISAAKSAIKNGIESGFPVAYLMLLHQDRFFKDYNWHWFLINGYDEAGDTFFVKAVTYSASKWLDLSKLWDTGNEQKGGIVIYSE